jgi:hypothetical protein
MQALLLTTEGLTKTSMPTRCPLSVDTTSSMGGGLATSQNCSFSFTRLVEKYRFFLGVGVDNNWDVDSYKCVELN